MNGSDLGSAIMGGIIAAIVVAVLAGMALGAGCTSCVGWWKHHTITVSEKAKP